MDSQVESQSDCGAITRGWVTVHGGGSRESDAQGWSDGVAIIIDEAANIEVALAELKAKLGGRGQLFSWRCVSPRRWPPPPHPSERDAISAIVKEFGIDSAIPVGETERRKPLRRTDGATVCTSPHC